MFDYVHDRRPPSGSSSNGELALAGPDAFKMYFGADPGFIE